MVGIDILPVLYHDNGNDITVLKNENYGDINFTLIWEGY